MNRIYRLETSVVIEDLENRVNAAIDEGYKILGSPVVVLKGMELVLVQAMVKPQKVYITDPNNLKTRRS